MKMLINVPTVSNTGIPIPWLLKFKQFSKMGADIDFNYGISIEKSKLDKLEAYEFNQKTNLFRTIPTFRLTKLNFTLFALIRNFRSLARVPYILKTHYDVIYSPSSVLDLIITPYILKVINPDIRWYSVFDNIVPFTDSGNKVLRFFAWSFYRISLILLNKADTIFYSSPILLPHLIGYGFQPQKLIFSSCGIEKDLILRSKPNSEKFDALFVGRLNETKGIYDMLDVLIKVKKSYPDFSLAIMGRGDEATELLFKNKIEKLGLVNQIKFLGYITGIERFNITKSSKLFLFLSKSKSECFGIALLESVCCGLPAITYDLEPYKHIYKKGEIFKFKVGDTQSVANKIIELFTSKNFNNPAGKKLVKKYSWSASGKKEFEIIRKAYEKHLSPPIQKG